jgi:hypothetical protein
MSVDAVVDVFISLAHSLIALVDRSNVNILEEQLEQCCSLESTWDWINRRARERGRSSGHLRQSLPQTLLSYDIECDACKWFKVMRVSRIIASEVTRDSTSSLRADLQSQSVTWKSNSPTEGYGKVSKDCKFLQQAVAFTRNFSQLFPTFL